MVGSVTRSNGHALSLDNPPIIIGRRDDADHAPQDFPPSHAWNVQLPHSII